MRLNTIIILCLLFMGFSCTHKKEPVRGVIAIELKESDDALPISSFIDELDYLELKASDGNIEIGDIQQIKVLSGDIIIKQRKAGEISLIRFSKNGDFINEIVNNKNGKVSEPLDIIEYQKDYAVLTRNGIHQISKLGKYKGEIISGEIAGKTFFRNKNSFLTINEIPTATFLTEYSTNKMPKRTTTPNERINKWIYTDVATPKHKEYHLISSFCDTVYAYRNKKLFPIYQFVGDTYPTMSEVWKNVGDRDPRETMRYIYDTQHVLVRNYLENKELIFISYWVGSVSNTLIIHKDNWEKLYFARAVNDIDGGIWDHPFYLSPNTELYVPISSYKIEGHSISNKWHKDFEQLQQQMANSGNPVIMRCHLE